MTPNAHHRAVIFSLLAIFVTFTSCLNITIDQRLNQECVDDTSSIMMPRVISFTTPVDLERLRESVIGTSTISNHLTALFTFNGILIIAYSVTGVAHFYVTETLNLPDVVRTTLKKLDPLFSPTSTARTVFTILRNAIFGIGGRIMFDFFSNPPSTVREFDSIRNEDLVAPVFTSNFLRIWLARFWVQFFSVTTGLAIAYYVADQRKKGEDRIDDPTFNPSFYEAAITV